MVQRQHSAHAQVIQIIFIFIAKCDHVIKTQRLVVRVRFWVEDTLSPEKAQHRHLWIGIVLSDL